MQVIWRQLFTASSRDHGTLGHLFSQLGRLPHAKVPKKDLHACVDALMTVFKGHIIAAACTELDIDHSNAEITDGVPGKKSTKEEKRKFMYTLARKIVDKLTIVSQSFLGKRIPPTNDKVHSYARLLCHYSSLVMEFTDAWSEGDGERVVRCWKLFLPHFYTNRRTKYALEALRLQLQLATLSPPLVHQLTWGRFVNTQGGKGRNIPCDLHNEHINKLFKEVVKNMGSNFSQESSTRVARCITSLASVAERFDSESSMPKDSSSHTTKSDVEDVKRVVKVIQQSKILDTIEGRQHSSYPKISCDPLASLDRKKMDIWIKKKILQRQKFTAMHEGNQSDSDASDDEDNS